MPAATLIAKLVGPLFVAIGLGVLLNRTNYAAAIAEGVRSPVLVYLAGMGTMLAGLAILNAHRAWTADWRVIVTVLGWLFIIAGIIRIVLPTVATFFPARSIPPRWRWRLWESSCWSSAVICRSRATGAKAVESFKRA